MIFNKLHEVRLNKNPQIVILDVKNHVLTDSISNIFIEQLMIRLFYIEIVFKQCFVIEHVYIDKFENPRTTRDRGVRLFAFVRLSLS